MRLRQARDFDTQTHHIPTNKQTPSTNPPAHYSATTYPSQTLLHQQPGLQHLSISANTAYLPPPGRRDCLVIRTRSLFAVPSGSHRLVPPPRCPQPALSPRATRIIDLDKTTVCVVFFSLKAKLLLVASCTAYMVQVLQDLVTSEHRSWITSCSQYSCRNSPSRGDASLHRARSGRLDEAIMTVAKRPVN